jgi:rubrerythrin
MKANRYKSSPWVKEEEGHKIDLEAERKLRLALDAAIADEAKAGKEYREMAQIATNTGRPYWARIIEEIAGQEDTHYQQLMSMMITLEPSYKSVSRVAMI